MRDRNEGSREKNEKQQKSKSIKEEEEQKKGIRGEKIQRGQGYMLTATKTINRSTSKDRT